MNLNIDITNLKKGINADISANYKGNLHFPEDNINNCNIDVRYKIINVGEGLYVSGKLDVNLDLICSRCINNFNYTMNIKLDDMCPYTQEDPCDNYFIDETMLDLKELLRQKINLSLPLKPLCKAECKGLCPSCGIDMNKKFCNCKIFEPDPRWAELGKFIKKNKGGELEI